MLKGLKSNLGLSIGSKDWESWNCQIRKSKEKWTIFAQKKMKMMQEAKDSEK